MKILTIETSGKVCGVALSVNQAIWAEFSSFSGNEHDRLLAEYIKRILADSGLKINDLDAVAVSAGPGSFTGVRIGGAMAKSLCYNGSPKLIAVPTADALAQSVVKFSKDMSKICVCIKSHKDLVYYRLYDVEAVPLCDIAFDSFASVEAQIDEKTVLCGNGFDESYNGVFLRDGISASVIAEYAMKEYKKNSFCDPIEFEPLYVQEFTPKIT